MRLPVDHIAAAWGGRPGNGDLLMKADLSKRLPAISLLVFYVSVFAPYITQNGFIVDDWGIVERGVSHPAYVANVASWYPFMTIRPLSSVFFGLSSFFLSHPQPYNVVNLLLYLAGFWLVGLTLKKLFGTTFFWLLLLTAPLSAISNVWIFSAPTYMGANFSILLWGWSLYLIDKDMETNRPVWYLGAYLCLLAGWLIYDLVPFLAVFNVFLPVMKPRSGNSGEGSWPVRQLLRYGLPLVVLALVILTYQKVITPWLGGMDISRAAVSGKTLRHLPGHFWHFLGVIGLQFPALLVSGLQYPFQSAFPLDYVLPILAGIVFILVTVRRPEDGFPGDDRQWLRVLLVLSAVLLINSLVFPLSARLLDISGYENRAVHGVWIFLSMLIAVLACRSRPALCRAPLLVYVVLLTTAFVTQRDHYSQSYREQLTIVNDCVGKAQSAAGFANGDMVIANVPQFLAENYNNEAVFTQPWDWGKALVIYSGGFIGGGAPFTFQKVEQKRISIKTGSVVFDDWWKADISRLWYYEYDQKTQRSQLLKVRDAQHLQRLLFHDVLARRLNGVEEPFHTRFRDILK